MTELEIKRVKHSFMVGKLMEAIAKQMPEEYPNPEEMFILGYLHDIGYNWGSGDEGHSKMGAQYTNASGYKYYQEIRAHSVYEYPYQSKELDLLRYCDLNVDGEGKIVTIEQRINDWSLRHGKEEIEDFVLKNEKEIKRLREKFETIKRKVLKEEGV